MAVMSWFLLYCHGSLQDYNITTSNTQVKSSLVIYYLLCDPYEETTECRPEWLA